jgi:myo-inositol 2-dehydrogenase/D-chiro-inositol 1-dehydrogenase
MSWPAIDFGHTSYAAAFTRGDVYGVKPEPARAAKRPLRLAIAGAGGVMQAKWLPAIRRLQTIGEPLAIAGVADADAAARDKAAMLTGVTAVADVPALLDTKPDALLVLTSDAAHAQIARAAIDRGIPVLVEKPLSRDAGEAAALAAHAQTANVLLGAVANKRFSPPYAMAKALIDGGALESAPTVFTGKFTLGYPYVDLLEGGTVHLIDLMRWFMGPVARLSARAVRDAGRLQSAVVSVAFASGAIGTLMTSAAGLSFKPWERVEVFGRNAFLVVDDQLETTLYDEETGPAKSWKPVVPNTLMFDESFGGYTGLLDNFLDAVRGLVPLGATGADGAAAIGVIEAVRRSIASSSEIDLVSEGLMG